MEDIRIATIKTRIQSIAIPIRGFTLTLNEKIAYYMDLGYTLANKLEVPLDYIGECLISEESAIHFTDIKNINRNDTNIPGVVYAAITNNALDKEIQRIKYLLDNDYVLEKYKDLANTITSLAIDPKVIQKLYQVSSFVNGTLTPIAGYHTMEKYFPHSNEEIVKYMEDMKEPTKSNYSLISEYIRYKGVFKVAFKVLEDTIDYLTIYVNALKSILTNDKNVIAAFIIENVLYHTANTSHCRNYTEYIKNIVRINDLRERLDTYYEKYFSYAYDNNLFNDIGFSNYSSDILRRANFMKNYNYIGSVITNLNPEDWYGDTEIDIDTIRDFTTAVAYLNMDPLLIQTYNVRIFDMSTSAELFELMPILWDIECVHKTYERVNKDFDKLMEMEIFKKYEETPFMSLLGTLTEDEIRATLDEMRVAISTFEAINFDNETKFDVDTMGEEPEEGLIELTRRMSSAFSGLTTENFKISARGATMFVNSVAEFINQFIKPQLWRKE